MIISHRKVKPEILRAVIEEFVTREGTDYGEQEYSLDEKVADVLAQLECGSVALSFNPEDESCSIVVV